MKKMVQDSMHGSGVNWKLYDSIMEERNQNDDYPALIYIGSCSLHVEHGALMVYSKPCTICLMSPLQKEKITKYYWI